MRSLRQTCLHVTDALVEADVLALTDALVEADVLALTDALVGSGRACTYGCACRR